MNQKKPLSLNNLPTIVYVLDFIFWKKPIIRSFLQDHELRYVNNINLVPENATLAVWGNRKFDNNVIENKKISLLRVEDGFLRSVGLGVDLIRPVSWVIDSRGIYYDATCISDLERYLQTTDFTPPLLERANKLRERIVENELTKYNVGTRGAGDNALSELRAKAKDRRILLVPGQVETDASIAYGAPEIRHNMTLLQAVREKHADAYIVYKPHPDVVAGLRVKGEHENHAQNWCDEIVTDRTMGELLKEVDEIHVLTSLTGFEALLRGKKVTCYGQPFYAGWGLTTDVVPISRRTRCLSLDELVAATLILYPAYVSRTTDCYITAEQAVDELLEWRSIAAELPRWRKAIRPLRRMIRPLLNAIGIR
ncbi:MAG: beta-3-deoxy-D-manno-oct-2-ulosonic acid transferase [Methylococcaceae bacterium]|nr:beta-3-deoxy-D-manno-oct-2-ulosonic acid transferase [Methylococcaceae bacterium]